MEHLNLAEIDGHVSMSYRDKLLRFARIVREHKHGIAIYSNIEFWNNYQLSQPVHPATVLGVAASDPVFKAMGLQPNPLSAMHFFGLNQNQLHEFSCDCGGCITNDQMADRIDRLANIR